MQDFKTGLLLRQSPKQQFLAQFMGIFVGVAVAIPTYLLFSSAYVLGSDEMPAPAAFGWMKVAQVLNKGFSALPDRCWISMAAMVALGVLLPCCAFCLRRSSRWAYLSACVYPSCGGDVLCHMSVLTCWLAGTYRAVRVLASRSSFSRSSRASYSVALWRPRFGNCGGQSTANGSKTLPLPG